MNRKILILGAALLAAPLMTSVVMSQTTTAPADAPAATAPAPASQPAPKELTDVISKGIDLLSAGKVKETVTLLAPPDDLAKQTADGGIDKLVEQFKSSGMDAKLLAALKAAKDQMPRLSDDGKNATYSKLDDSTPPLEFTKINDSWYLR